MKIIKGVAVAVAILSILCVIPVFNERAQAYDPRAEVPGAAITGIILDANGNNVPNATVKLFLDGHLFDVPGNPRQSNKIADPSGSIGRYQFTRLPYGQYLIVAEIQDAAGNVHRSNLTLNVNANTITADIVISDLVIAAGTPAPSATAPAAGKTSLCGAGLLVPLSGIGILMINKKRKL